MATSTATRPVTIEFGSVPNEQDVPMLWLAGWLDVASGTEGAWFYSGRGGEAVTVNAPPGITAIRVRRWTSDGLPPEYADVELDAGRVEANNLDFDRWRGFTRTADPIFFAREASDQHA